MMNSVCVCVQVVQVFIGGLCVLFSLSAVYSDFLILHAPFCLAVSVRRPSSLPACRRSGVRGQVISMCLCSGSVCGLRVSGSGGAEADFVHAGESPVFILIHNAASVDPLTGSGCRSVPPWCGT